jgi:hypothetical protein
MILIARFGSTLINLIHIARAQCLGFITQVDPKNTHDES